MPKSTNSLVFPDINVWLALAYQGHVHHSVANRWFQSLPDDFHPCFCRFTQIGLLRLLTTSAVMGEDEVLTQLQAWRVYDACMADGRTLFLGEPSTLETRFRALTQEERASPKDWADSYLLAFAFESGLTLITFDRALQKKSKEAVLLD
jgi:toxin-antitoxin system PIN domain toxin